MLYVSGHECIKCFGFVILAAPLGALRKLVLRFRFPEDPRYEGLNTVIVSNVTCLNVDPSTDFHLVSIILLSIQRFSPYVWNGR